MFTHSKHSLAAFQAAQRQVSLRTKIVASMVAFSVVTSLIVAGCGGGGTSVAQNNSRPYAPFTPINDLLYIDGMMPHHEMAVMMAEHELEHGSRPQLKAIAQKIKASQMEEITLFKSMRKALTGQEKSPETKDQHMEDDMKKMMDLMGAQMDSYFIQHMIPHHAEAISMAHRALPYLRNSDLVQNAKNVVRDQAVEIGQLQALKTDQNY